VAASAAAVHGRGARGGLALPCRASLGAVCWPHTLTIYSVGTARTGGAGGGGKTSEQEYEALRHRFATGTFARLERAALAWAAARADSALFPLPPSVAAVFAPAALVPPPRGPPLPRAPAAQQPPPAQQQQQQQLPLQGGGFELRFADDGSDGGGGGGEDAPPAHRAWLRQPGSAALLADELRVRRILSAPEDADLELELDEVAAAALLQQQH